MEINLTKEEREALIDLFELVIYMCDIIQNHEESGYDG